MTGSSSPAGAGAQAAPVDANAMLAHALRLHNAGKVGVAAELYQRVLELVPEQPYALHLLGEIMLRQGRHDRAIELITRAVAHLPDHAEAHNNLGAALQGARRSAEAETNYRRAIALNPGLAIAHSNLGALLLARGRGADADSALRQALALAPGLADAHLNLGNLQRMSRNFPAAEASYRQAIASMPRNAGAYVNLGLALAGQGRIEEATDAYLKATILNPRLPEAHINLGKLHAEQARHAEAEACYRHVIDIAPDNADAHNNLGVTLFSQRRYAEAAVALRRAVDLAPDFSDAYNNLGATLRMASQLTEAVACFERALTITPDKASIHNNRGLSLMEMGRVEEGLVSLRKATRLKARFARAHSNYLFALNYLTDMTPDRLLEEHRAFEAAFVQAGGAAEPVGERDRDPKRRLRVGYVSPDFVRHSCSYFIEPLLAHHDKTAVEIFCYADVPRVDDVTERIKSHADQWRESKRLNRDEFRALVAADNIDILVDLAGHTGENRLSVLVDRLAPVQVNWLGYPATTGLSAMDYRLTDARVDPLGASDGHGTETLLRLPDSFLCYQPPADAPPVAPPPNAAGAPFTFASFNNIPKVTREVVATWARILRQAPGTRLFLKSRPFADAPTRQRFVDAFEAEGVDSQRLEFIAWTSDPNDHLRLYERVDLALDPFPYNGTTTTCEAMWMGVPVLTLAGTRHAARVGASLLGGLGLETLVVTSIEDYVARAVSLAQAPAALNALRPSLRTRMAGSALCDGPRFARSVEAAYRDMWRSWCARAPVSDATSERHS